MFMALYHLLYEHVHVCVWLDIQSCPPLCNPMDCSPSDSSVHGVFVQARILGWAAIASSRGLPDLGIKRMSLLSPALQVDSLPAEPSGK